MHPLFLSGWPSYGFTSALCTVFIYRFLLLIMWFLLSMPNLLPSRHCFTYSNLTYTLKYIPSTSSFLECNKEFYLTPEQGSSDFQDWRCAAPTVSNRGRWARTCAAAQCRFTSEPGSSPGRREPLAGSSTEL